MNQKQILIDHLDGVSYRKLQRRSGVRKQSLCDSVNLQTAGLQNNFEITQQLISKLKYSGNHVVDGKYVPVKEVVPDDSSGNIPRSKKRRKVVKGKVLIWGADYESHDILNFEFGDSESGTVFNSYFRQLKSINYPMISLTLDDKREIASAAKRHFPNCIIQLCIKHYLAKINRILTISHIRIKINAKQNQLEKLFVSPDSEYIPTSRPQSVKQAAKLWNEITELHFRYELLLDFQNAIVSILTAADYQTAIYRIESLENYFWPKRQKMDFPKDHIRTIRKSLTDFRENKEYLLNYLKYPHLNIPSTTNLVEGFNSQLELRLSSIRGFETETTAKNYLNAWIVKRRFTKFTDCRGQFKKLNRKSPIECAGADISDVQKWLKTFQI